MSELAIGGGTTYELVLAPQAPTVIDLTSPGPQGPPGPPGPAGGAQYLYSRDGVPAATWTVAHNLGRPVHVTVISDTGREVLTDVEHPDINTAVVTFAEPFSGTALIG